MEKITLHFQVDKQSLTIDTVPKIVSKTINYVDARFDLSEEWQSFDIIQAIFSRNEEHVAVNVINGYCIVPSKVLDDTGLIRVNLVGSVIQDSELIARLTTAPIIALKIGKDAYVDGGEDEKITPSQFEEFVATVKNDTAAAVEAKDIAVDAKDETVSAKNIAVDAKDEATNSASIAVASKKAAEESAEKAEQMAAKSGYMFFEITHPEGHLILERTENTAVDFTIGNGHLILEEVTHNGN